MNEWRSGWTHRPSGQVRAGPRSGGDSNPGVPDWGEITARRFWSLKQSLICRLSNFNAPRRDHWYPTFITYSRSNSVSLAALVSKACSASRALTTPTGWDM